MSNSNPDSHLMIESIEEELGTEVAPEQYKDLAEAAKGLIAIRWDDNGEPVVRVSATIKGSNAIRLIRLCRMLAITPGSWVTEKIRDCLMSPVITSYLKASSHPDP